MTKHSSGFFDFIRERGVVGLAIGFVIGGSVTKLVTSLVTDVVNPLIGPVLGAAGDLKDLKIPYFSGSIMIGSFLSNLIDFIVIAMVVYAGFKLLKLDKLDKPRA